VCFLVVFILSAGLGVYISRIEENSVAERAGLRPGDTILEVNGTPFTSINHEEALKVSNLHLLLFFLYDVIFFFITKQYLSVANVVIYYIHI